MIRGVVFDMDGVVADTEPLHARSWERLFARRGLSAPKGYFDRFIGVCDTDTVPVINRDLGLRLEAEATISARLDLFEELLAERGLPPNPGFPEFHALCRRAGLPLGVATGSWRRTVSAVLKAVSPALGGAPAFDVVVTRDDVTRPKPDPESYRLACARLKVAPTECLAVEDSPSGVAAAVGAGLRCVALAGPCFPPAALARAHVVLSGPKELDAALLRPA